MTVKELIRLMLNTKDDKISQIGVKEVHVLIFGELYGICNVKESEDGIELLITSASKREREGNHE